MAQARKLIGTIKERKYENTDIIKLKPHDRKDLDLDYDDEVDIENIEKINNSKKKK